MAGLVGALVWLHGAAAMAQAVPNAAADESLTQKSRELFAEGNAYSAKGDFVKARAALKAAWGLMHHWGIAANLGEVELEIGNHRDAAEMLDFALRNWPDEDYQQERRAVRKAFEKARAKVGTVEVTVDVEGATVSVDGDPVGQAPLPGPVFVEPGRRVFSTKAPRMGRVQKAIEAEAGGTANVSLALEATEGASQPPDGPTGESDHGNTKVEPGDDSTKAIVVGTGVGLTLVGAGIAVVFKLRANAAQTDADENRERAYEQLGGPCPDADAAPVCAEHADALDRRNTSNKIATGAFVGATVVGAATLTTWLLWPDDPQRSVAPSASRDFVGFRWSGSF